MANNELLTLAEIFNDKIFRIPDYQRGYAWGKEQVEDFWEDILNIKEAGTHYTGLLTVEEIKKENIENKDNWEENLWLFKKNYKAYYLIDGQQRLTTSIILIKVILDQFEDCEDLNYEGKNIWKEKFLVKKYKDKYESYIFGYDKDNPSNEYFKTFILGEKSLEADKYPTETLYTKNLKITKEFFEEKLEKFSKEDLENVFSKVINNLKFNFYEMAKELNAYVTFETMNNRGKPLSKLELLKNRLMYLTTLLDESELVKSKIRKDINEVWKTIYEYLGKNTKRTLDDDDFLYNHWIMYFKYERSKSNAFSSFLLDKYFTSKRVLTQDKENKIDYLKIKNYITSLSRSIKEWYYMHNPESFNQSNEIKEMFNKLNRVGWGAFKPLVLSYMVKDYDDQKLKMLLEANENFVFLVFRVSRRQASAENNNFYRMANNLYYDKIGIEDCIEEIQHLIEYEEDEDFGWCDIERFQDYMKDQFKKANGFYSWNGLKYLLYEYEMFLQEENNESMKVSWETVKDKNSVEHIYPQEASKEYWSERFNKYSEKQRNLLLNSLGNLLLLSQAKNSKLQNNGFDLKVTGYRKGSHSEIEVAENSEWNPNDILNRGLKILDFMEENWGLEFDDKKKLLGLDFM